MQKNATSSNARNPFAEGKNEKDVWKELVQNARPLKKDDFLRIVELKKQQKN